MSRPVPEYSDDPYQTFEAVGEEAAQGVATAAARVSTDSDANDEVDTKEDAKEDVLEPSPIDLAHVIRSVLGGEISDDVISLLASQSRGVMDVYDLVASFKKDNDGTITTNETLSRRLNAIKAETAVPYGLVFSSPDFDRERRIEMLDIERRNAGPTLQEGVVTCTNAKCQSKKTQTIEKQISSADEPSHFFHTCMQCNNRWKTRG